MGFALELAGSNASWYFDTGKITVRYATGMRANALLKSLFAASVLAAIRAQPPAAITPAVSPTDDVVSAIRKLGELHEAGLLTEEEFQRKKTELLDRM